MEIKNAWSLVAVKKNMVIWIGVVVLIVIVGVIALLIGGKPSAPHATFAPQGQVISGFPKELVLNNTAIVDNSYTIGYSANLNQYTANWTSSSSSLDSLYNQYFNYFTSNGWTITNSSTNISAFRGIYAVTSTADANVTLDGSNPSAVKITVSYVKK